MSALEVKLSCWLPEQRDPADDPPPLEAWSEVPADECELCLRDGWDLRFAVEVATTNFFVGPVFFFVDLSGRFDVVVAVAVAVGNGRTVPSALLASVPAGKFRFALGLCSSRRPFVPVSFSSSTSPSSSSTSSSSSPSPSSSSAFFPCCKLGFVSSSPSDSGGDAKRAVGRGPDFEFNRCFLRIG